MPPRVHMRLFPKFTAATRRAVQHSIFNQACQSTGKPPRVLLAERSVYHRRNSVHHRTSNQASSAQTLAQTHWKGAQPSSAAGQSCQNACGKSKGGRRVHACFVWIKRVEQTAGQGAGQNNVKRGVQYCGELIDPLAPPWVREYQKLSAAGLKKWSGGEQAACVHRSERLVGKRHAHC